MNTRPTLFAVFIIVLMACTLTYVLIEYRLQHLPKPPPAVDMSAFISQLQQQTQTQQLLQQQLANTQQTLTTVIQSINDEVEHSERVSQLVTQTQQQNQQILNIVEQLLPIGSIITYTAKISTAQQQLLQDMGWLICKGQRVKSQDFPKLAVLMNSKEDSFHLPACHKLNTYRNNFTFLIKVH